MKQVRKKEILFFVYYKLFKTKMRIQKHSQLKRLKVLFMFSSKKRYCCKSFSIVCCEGADKYHKT